MIFSRFGGRIVIARCVDLVQQIVRVQVRKFALHVFLQEFIGGIAGRQGDLHLDRRAAGNEQQAGCGTQRCRRLAVVFTLLPLRIGADRVHDEVAPQAVASGNLHG